MPPPTMKTKITQQIKRRMWICFFFGSLLLIGGSASGANFDAVGLNVAQSGGFLVICVSFWILHLIGHHEREMKRLEGSGAETIKK